MTNKSLKKGALVPVLLAIFFLAICYWLVSSAPQSKRKYPERELPKVEVMSTSMGAFDVNVEAHGQVVAAHHRISLTSQVTGQLIATHVNFRPGGFIKAGESIIQVDKTDYQLAVKETHANLVKARASVALELGQQQIAQKQFALSPPLKDQDEQRVALALRQPQLDTSQADMLIAQVEHDKAILALNRTTLSFPFDVHVIESAVSVGEVASSGMTLAKLSRADKSWVELKLQQKYLTRLRAKDNQVVGSLVTFEHNQQPFYGEVISIRADLANGTRMAGVLVEVNMSNRALPLILGTHVTAKIAGGVISDSMEIPRRSLLNDQNIHVVDNDDRLRKRKVNILWEKANTLIVRPDFHSGDQVITSRIAGIVPGSLVEPISSVHNDLVAVR